ncbi:DUF2085 domain-containing protein [Clostridium saccharoperbutylacetonicum]
MARDLSSLMDKKTKIWIFLMKLGAYSCHQIYERSFTFRGYQFPVCARCTGLFLGNILGVFLSIIKIKINLKISLLLIFIMAFDGFLQLLKIKNSNNIRRLLTGFFAGIGYVFILVNIVSYFI